MKVAARYEDSDEYKQSVQKEIDIMYLYVEAATLMNTRDAIAALLIHMGA